MRSVKKNQYVDLNRDEVEFGFNFPAFRDHAYVCIDPSSVTWDEHEMCDVCRENGFTGISWNNGLSTNKIINTGGDSYYEGEYADEPDCEESCEECEESCEKESKGNARPLRPRVIAVLFKRRSSYRNIHYAI